MFSKMLKKLKGETWLVYTFAKKDIATWSTYLLMYCMYVVYLRAKKKIDDHQKWMLATLFLLRFEVLLLNTKKWNWQRFHGYMPPTNTILDEKCWIGHIGGGFFVNLLTAALTNYSAVFYRLDVINDTSQINFKYIICYLCSKSNILISKKCYRIVSLHIFIY